MDTFHIIEAVELNPNGSHKVRVIETYSTYPVGYEFNCYRSGVKVGDKIMICHDYSKDERPRWFKIEELPYA